ncbi:hypothetical protein GCM10007423_64050 [Dyadobacter endophyticus]|uniref:Uncharacterized protein n=1 Tax=Dyadobacter endophyticus TaxID=1749036 RepID=A0ABQ1ZB25_9BACT|nr:hypothetical protein GCM10007423_64050 [Dyadobacter endophyticus]
MPFSIFSQDVKCGEIIAGIYNYEDMKTNVSYRRHFLDYLYRANFKSSEDVVSAGISLQAIIPTEVPGVDIPFIGSGNFDKKKYDEWRSSYQKKVTDDISLDESMSRARQWVEIEVVKAWSKCVFDVNKAKEKGVVAEIIPIDTETVEFKATFVPVSGIDHTTINGKLEVTNGTILTKVTDNAFKNSGILGTGDRSVLIKLVPGRTLIVRLYTKNHTVTKKYPAILPGSIQSFDSDKTDVFPGELVSLSWQALNVKDLKLDGTQVNSSGSQKVPVSSKHTFNLVGIDAFGKKNQKSLTVNVKPAPVHITSCVVNVAVPAWVGTSGDGKEGPTLLGFTFTSEDQKTVLFEGRRGGQHDPCPLVGGQALDIPLTMMQSDLLLYTKDKLPRFHSSFTKMPHGHDQCIFEITGKFNLSDGTDIKFVIGQMRMMQNTTERDNRVINVAWQ